MTRFPTEKCRFVLIDSCLAILPFLVIFILIPTTLFFGNFIEFKSDYLSLVPLYLLVGILFLFLFFILYAFPSHIRNNISGLLFWTGIFMLLSDLCFSVKWDMKETDYIIHEPLWQIIAQFVLVGIILWCAFRFSLSRVKKIIVPFVASLFIVNIVVFTANYFVKTKKRNSMQSSHTQSVQRNSIHSAIGNTYHIIFDAYSSDEFNKLLDDKEVIGKLRGFVFYKNTFSNYITTGFSVPSFLTGTFYREDYARWMLRPCSEGIFEEVAKAGWSLWQYIPDQNYSWRHEKTQNSIIGSELLNESIVRLRTFRLIKFSSVRIAPVILRKETLCILDRILGYLFFLLNPYAVVYYGLSEYKQGDLGNILQQVPMCRHFIEQESIQQETGRYVFAHFIFPHPPMVWDSECNFVQESSYSEQCLCAAKFIFKFIQVLKDTGRFDNSLIVIHGDHGEESALSLKLPALTVPDEILTKFSSVGMVISSEQYLNYSRPFLLIKQPFSSAKPLVVSDVQVQLADLPASIYHLLSIDRETEEGESLFRVRNTSDREIHMFVTSREKPLKVVHISFTSDKGWRLYPDIPQRKKINLEKKNNEKNKNDGEWRIRIKN